MRENDPLVLSNKHLRNTTAYETLMRYHDEYNSRLKWINLTYSKLYSIFMHNNINDKILDNMRIKSKEEQKIVYELTNDSNRFFMITLEFFDPKRGPKLTLSIVNKKSKYHHTELFYAYDYTEVLPPSFMMAFRTLFGHYYLNE